jgi:hypothetical protein
LQVFNACRVRVDLTLANTMSTPTRFLSSEEATERLVPEEIGKNYARLEILAKNGIKANEPYPIRFCFLSNDPVRAAGLTKALQTEHGYLTEPLKAADSPFEVFGIASGVSLEIDVLNRWTLAMCKVGFDHDCKFNGWMPMLTSR